MGIEFNPASLNANDIFARLDAADGKNDGRINKSIWNAFAAIAGGKEINNFIEKTNAIRSISSYLSKASDEVKAKISEYLNKTPETFDSATSEARTQEGAANSAVASNETKSETTKEEVKRKFFPTQEQINDRKNRKVDGYDFTEHDLVGDSIFVIFDRHKTSTTDERRKEVLNTKGKNGYNYVTAKKTIDDIEEKYLLKWRNAVDPNDGKQHNTLWFDVWMHNSLASDEVRANNRKLLLEVALRKMTDEDRKIYEEAKADFAYLSARYTDADICYEDLQMIYFYGPQCDA